MQTLWADMLLLQANYITPQLSSVYAPNWDNTVFFANFLTWLPDLSEHHLIIGGDMNCVLAPSLDRSSDKLY